jgi:mannosyltransferase OCH1-like enzyme
MLGTVDIKQFFAILIPILFIIALLPEWQSNILNFSETIIGKLIFICVILFYAEINIMYGFLALVFVVFFYKIFFTMTSNSTIHSNKSSNTFLKEPGPLLSKRLIEPDDYHKVPLIIYQTWATKDLPPKMTACVNRLKTKNPEFDHYLYDDADCRDFIKTNFDQDVLDAYDQLIPGAYKADLWRYCVLYKTGGIYLDIKFQCEPGFSLLELTDDNETFVLDRPYPDFTIPLKNEFALLNSPTFYNTLAEKADSSTWKNKQVGLYNAVMATIPNNPVLYDCIQKIVVNVKNKIYDYHPLYPTGPGLLGEVYFKGNYKSNVKKMKYFNSLVGNYILTKNKKVLSHYPEYREEQRKYTKAGNNYYYSDLWVKNNIYLTIISK